MHPASIAELSWRELRQLPNVVFIRSRRGHQTIADALIPLLEASPLYADHVAQIRVHALSDPRSLEAGLKEAAALCAAESEPWCVALVRGGGAESTMDQFASTLEHPDVRPLIEALSSRLIFAAGHARDSQRSAWVRERALAAGIVPNEAATRFVDRLRMEDVFRRVHEAARILHLPEDGLPAPQELGSARRARQLNAFRSAAKLRYSEALEQASIISDAEFFEMMFRGGLLMEFLPHGRRDVRPVGFSQDHQLFIADGAYTVEDWIEIFERMGIEDEELQDAIGRSRR